MQVCISYLFIFVPVINEEYYEKDKKIGSVVLAASKDIPAAGFTDYLLALTKKLFHKS